ncbi:MAG: FHA domain-containing protein, partial [Planctomycetes bacterium]|nr:FHA domain-containing protein [Planctomycetota bacterium]
MKLHLSVVHTANPGAPPRDFEFSVGPVAVGRSALGQIVIEGPAISRVHVSFDTVHGAWHVTHEGSAAPTFLNGSQLPKGRPTRVADGDRVVVGSHEVVVALPQAGESIPGIEPLRDSFVSRLDDEEPGAAAPLPPSIFAAPQASAFPFPAAAAPAPARPGPAGRVVPTLVAVRGAPETTRLELSDTSKHYVIGRAATCDLTLNDTSISRQHAFARFDGSRAFVRDAQARSPVRVNDRPIVGETPLSHGDVVSVGPVDLKFLCEADPVAAPEPEDTGRATFIPKDERTQMVQRGGISGESAPPVADVPWQPAALDSPPAFPAAAPAASHAAPAPWDRAAQPAPAAPSWEAAAAVPPPAE